MSNEGVIHRRVLEIAVQRLLDEPVLLLQGPRTCGKTFLLNDLAKACGAKVIDLDDPPTLDAVRSDAETFMSGPSPVLVDEYQHERSVLAAIKAQLNKDLRPGRFVLAGSTRSTSIPEVAEYLAGRVSRIPVLPFSQGEIEGVHERFVEVLLFGDPQSLMMNLRSTTTRMEYAHRIVKGGMPLAVARTNAVARNRWYDEYVPLVLARVVGDIRSIRQPERLSAFLNKLASQTGQVLNIKSAAESVSIDRHTAVEYLSVLEDVFLVRQLPAWGSTLSSRTTKSPKVHMMDSGLAARLMRVTPDRLARRDVSALTEFGHLLETFAVGELIKQATWLDALVRWNHWRTRDGDEVDLVLERDDGCIVGIEVKAGTRVVGRDLAGLEKLRQLAGDAFLSGVALYTGERCYSPSDKIYVMPLDRVWSHIE